MYLVYCFVLLVFVYVSPGLALFPRLLLSARTAIAIPFVSIFAVGLIEKTLSAAGAFSQAAVLSLSAALALTALYRVRRLFLAPDSKFEWPSPQVFLLIFNGLVAFGFAAELGTTSFALDDEIYSWNMWAVQHYLGEPIDYYYTGYPYPQLFAVLIAYCYKFLGSIELQLPVRALFGIFPFCLLSAIALAPREVSYGNAVKFSVLALVLLFGASASKYMNDGLADPMMVSALVMSVFLFICFDDREGKSTEWLWIAVICGVVAAYSKQPALIWTGFALPILTLVNAIRRQWSPTALWAAGFGMLVSIAWVIGEGSGFQQNKG